MAATELDQMADGGLGQLEILIAEQGTTTTIALGGEWDLAAQPAIRQAIQSVCARSPECVVLDLSQLTLIEASAIDVVLGLQKRCTQQNVRLVITPGPRAVQRRFEILGLTSTLPFLTTAAWR
jgi:anti-anti-sigma factor